MKINMDWLNTREEDMKGANTKIYFLNEKLLAKRFIGLNDIERRKKFERYEYAKDIKNISNISLPIDILETEKGFCGYIENIIPGTHENKLINFGDFVNNHKYDLKLSDIVAYILKCASIIDECHKNKIVIPDLSTGGNVLYNTDNKEVHFIDYQDMQVGDIKTNAISSFILLDRVLKLEKYYSNGLYSPNIDLYTLAVRFFYYATKINVPRASIEYNIDQLLEMSGIQDTLFAECMRTLYNPNTDNMDIKDAIIELGNNYELTKFKQGEVRRLIKK